MLNMASPPFEIEMELEHKAGLCACSHCQVFEAFADIVDKQAQATGTVANWGITVGVGSIATLSAGVSKETVIVTPSGRLTGRLGVVPSSSDFEFVEYFSESAHMKYAEDNPLHFSSTISKEFKTVLKLVLCRDGKMDQILEMSSATQMCKLCTGHALDLNQDNANIFSKRSCLQNCKSLKYKDYCIELDTAVDNFFSCVAHQDPSEEDKARMRSTLIYALLEPTERSKMKTEWQMKTMDSAYTGADPDAYQLILDCHQILSSNPPKPPAEIATSISSMYTHMQSYFGKAEPRFYENYISTMRKFASLEPDLRVEVFQALSPAPPLTTRMQDFLRNPPAKLVQIRKISKQLFTAGDLNNCQQGILGRYRDVIAQSTVQLNDLLVFFNWCAEDNFVEAVSSLIASGTINASEVQKIKFSAYNKKKPLKRCNFCELKFENYLCHAGNFVKKPDAPPIVAAPVVASVVLTTTPLERKNISTRLRAIMNDVTCTNQYVDSLAGDDKTFAKLVITRKFPNWVF